MNIKNIEINGLRGFGKPQKLYLGIPDGALGSGLTILVGPNNSGKSTIIEAFNALTKRQPPSFSEGKRNKKSENRISIKLTNISDETKELHTVDFGGSETRWENENIEPLVSKIFVLTSRRTFNPFFSKGKSDRREYILSGRIPEQRGSSIGGFQSRLFKIQENKVEFDAVLKKVLDPLPNWVIELSDHNNYYIKFDYGDINHNSDGLGEGLISLFFLIDALYDSNEGDIIVIDEPELSLHPQLQKRLSNLLAEYSRDRQIVIATHSPYFIGWDSILNGAKLTKLMKEYNDIVMYQISDQTLKEIKKLVGDLHNPHVIGLDACEVFFLEDDVVLVEGQEDVIVYNKILEELGIELSGRFYGWGVGGANKMPVIASLLFDLGFKNVVGILDGNEEDVKLELETRYPEFRFFTIPTDDVRDKRARASQDPKYGLADHNGNIKPEYSGYITDLFNEINFIFSQRTKMPF